MRDYEFTSKFKKDLKREKKKPDNRDIQKKLDVVLKYLEKDLPLPPHFEDHPLIGNYVGHRGCHIRPDIVLIYKKPNKRILRLVRIGNHTKVY